MKIFINKKVQRVLAVICMLAITMPTAALASEAQGGDEGASESQTTQEQSTETSSEESSTDSESGSESQEPAVVVVDTGDAQGMVDVTNNVNVTHTDVKESETTDTPDEEDTQESVTSDSEQQENTEENTSTEEEQEEKQSSSEDESTESSNSQTNKEQDEDNEDETFDTETNGTSTTAENTDNGTSTNVAKVTGDTSVTIDQDVDADVDNGVSSTAATGDNVITDNEGNVILQTGNATLISNILNLINFNVIGTNAMTTAVNIIGAVVEDLDLSRFHSEKEIAEEVENTEQFQKFVAENIGNEGDTNIAEVEVDNSVNVNTTSTADVVNNVKLQAKTGKNIVKQNGSVMVRTGDVFLASNVANIVNTTVIGDGFTLAIVNIIGSQFGGNIILPSLTAKDIQNTEVLQGQCDQCGAGAHALNSNNENSEINVAQTEVDNSTSIEVKQDADVANDVQIKADTGDNTVSNNQGDVAVVTGHSTALSQVLNYVNTSIIGNKYVYGVVNIANGAWNGNIWGVPAEGFVVENHGSYITFKNTPEALTVYSNEFAGSEKMARAENKNNKGGTNKTHTIIDNETGVVTVQEVNIENNVSLDADSGDNEVSDNDGNVYLETGNVFALSNIFNMANTSVVGNDVVFAYVNILGGEWNGDINFGMPDLHIVEVANPVGEQAKPGGFVDYTIIVTNKGDAAASNVAVEAQTDPGMVAVDIAEGATVDENGLITWTIPKLGIGEMETFYYRAQIHDTAKNQEVVENNAFTYAAEDDRNLEDNRAETEVIVYGKPGPNVAGFGFPITFSGEQGGPSQLQQQPQERDASAYENPIDSDDIIVTQSNNTSGLISKGQTVTFTLTVENTKDESFYDVIVWDELLGPDSEPVALQNWKLGEVYPLETIEITYTVRFDKESAVGSYVNSVWADGFDGADQYLIFPEKKDTVVIRDEIDPASINVGIDYSHGEEKYVDVVSDESVVITNKGDQGISTGVAVVRYDSQFLQVNKNTRNSFALPVPSLQPGESYTLPLSVLPLQLTDRTQLNIEYIIGSDVVSSLSTFQRIVPEPRRQVVAQASAQEQTSRSTDDVGGDADAGQLAYLDGREPKVLGYEETVAGNSTLNRYVASRDMLWLVAWLGIVSILWWLHRRRKQEDEA